MFQTAATRTAAALSVAAAARAAALLWVVAAVAAAGCGFALPASSVAAGEAIDWHAEPYSIDGGAFLSPVDLVMTWGRLPEEPYRSRVSYYQLTRYYFWRTGDAGLDLRYIATHSANMHMIPSTRNLGRALAHLGRGDRVRVRGLLVDVSTAGGFRWATSLSRDDTGPGACELVWVEELQRGNRLYR